MGRFVSPRTLAAASIALSWPLAFGSPGFFALGFLPGFAAPPFLAACTAFLLAGFFLAPMYLTHHELKLFGEKCTLFRQGS